MKFLPAALVSLLFLVSGIVSGQKKERPLPELHNKDFVYHARKMDSVIRIDGVTDDPDWQVAQKATDFYLVLPIDTGKAGQPSEVMLTYDDKAFYMAIIFYDTVPGKRISESFRRDFNFGTNDNFISLFHTFLDQNNDFFYGVSNSGAVRVRMMQIG